MWDHIPTQDDYPIDMTSIPANTELQLDSNAITIVTTGAFSHFDGKPITVLNLQFNKISIVETNAFVELGLLRNLNLRDNKIEILRPGMFNGLGQLYKLTLGNNVITQLVAKTFEGLFMLEQLEIQFNQLTRLENNAMYGLTGPMTQFSLHGNHNFTCVKDGWYGTPNGTGLNPTFTATIVDTWLNGEKPFGVSCDQTTTTTTTTTVVCPDGSVRVPTAFENQVPSCRCPGWPNTNRPTPPVNASYCDGGFKCETPSANNAGTSVVSMTNQWWKISECPECGCEEMPINYNVELGLCASAVGSSTTANLTLLDCGDNCSNDDGCAGFNYMWSLQTAENPSTGGNMTVSTGTCQTFTGYSGVDTGDNFALCYRKPGLATSTSSSSLLSEAAAPADNSGLSAGAVAGIAVGAVVFIAVIGGAAAYFR